MMTLKQEVQQHDVIFSLMYAPTRVASLSLEDQIIEIKISKLEWFLDEEGFYYIWGWPGPDCNRYTREDYGKAWAYTKEEIIEAWNEE